MVAGVDYPTLVAIDRQPNRPVELPRAAARLADGVEHRARRKRDRKDVVPVPVGHKERLRTRSEARWTTQRVIRLCAEDSPQLPCQSKDLDARVPAIGDNALVVGDNEVQGALEPSRCSARRRRITATSKLVTQRAVRCEALYTIVACVQHVQQPAAQHRAVRSRERA